MLPAGLEVSPYVQVDDTGARHQGRNGYCTHIGNDLFATFESTDSKSRLNFLEVLRRPHTDYVINEVAVAYWERQKLAAAVRGEAVPGPAQLRGPVRPGTPTCRRWGSPGSGTCGSPPRGRCWAA